LGGVTPIDITIPEGDKPKSAAPAAAAATAAPATNTADAIAVMKKAQQFVGGKAALDAVKSMHQVLDVTMKTPQGEMAVEMDTTTRYPDSQKRVVKTPMGEMTTVVSPNASFRSGPMGSGDLPASQRDQALKEIHMDLLTILRSVDQPGYTFTSGGMEKVGDVN